MERPRRKLQWASAVVGAIGVLCHGETATTSLAGVAVLHLTQAGHACRLCDNKLDEVQWVQLIHKARMAGEDEGLSTQYISF
jgi:hypothetical protein